jgi:hypothetical protein
MDDKDDSTRGFPPLAHYPSEFSPALCQPAYKCLVLPEVTPPPAHKIKSIFWRGKCGTSFCQLSVFNIICYSMSLPDIKVTANY